MPNRCIEAVVTSAVHDSFHVRQVAGMFDVPLAAKCSERIQAEVPDESDEWRIGAIVGPSASGKSTIARQAFGDRVVANAAWPTDKAVVDCFGGRTIKQITHMLTAVGFSSPPSWIKAYQALSNGEQFRCDLARALLGTAPVVVFDEFTSVVDRTVARIGSAAVSKAIRGGSVQPRFVAVTCHYDVIEWLAPDWVLDMATRSLNWGRLRRPDIELEIVRCRKRAWRLFAPHHYLNASLPSAAQCYLAVWNGYPVGLAAVANHFGNARRGARPIRRISRIVVLPDFQGIGIGGQLLTEVADLYAAQGYDMRITTGHPGMIGFLKHSPAWRIYKVGVCGYQVRKAWRGRWDAGTAGRTVVSAAFVPCRCRLPGGTAPTGNPIPPGRRDLPNAT